MVHSGGYDVLDTGEMGPSPQVPKVEGFAGSSYSTFTLTQGIVPRLPVAGAFVLYFLIPSSRGSQSSFVWRRPISDSSSFLATCIAPRSRLAVFTGRPKTKVQFWSVRFAQNARALRKKTSAVTAQMSTSWIANTGNIDDGLGREVLWRMSLRPDRDSR